MAAALALSSVIVSAPAMAAERTIITLVQQPPLFSEIPQATDELAGTGFVFLGTLTRNGKPFGFLEGTKMTIEHSSWPGAADDQVQQLRTLILRLPGGQIVAEGSSTFDTTTKLLPPGKQAAIPVIGGTGKYFGARGELRTTLNADGTYKQVVILAK